MPVQRSGCLSKLADPNRKEASKAEKAAKLPGPGYVHERLWCQRCSVLEQNFLRYGTLKASVIIVVVEQLPNCLIIELLIIESYNAREKKSEWSIPVLTSYIYLVQEGGFSVLM